MSQGWFWSFAKSEQIHVVRRGSRPGVDWTTVEAHIARSRVIRVNESLRPNPDPGRPVRGVALLDRVKAPYGWSDRQLARALGVNPTVVVRYRRVGVPDHQACRVRRLSRLPLEAAAVSALRRRRHLHEGWRLSVKLSGGWDAIVAPHPSDLRWPNRPRTARRWCSKSDIRAPAGGYRLGEQPSKRPGITCSPIREIATRLFATPRFKERWPPCGRFLSFLALCLSAALSV
jgi:hypothetical protein